MLALAFGLAFFPAFACLFGSGRARVRVHGDLPWRLRSRWSRSSRPGAPLRAVHAFRGRCGVLDRAWTPPFAPPPRASGGLLCVRAAFLRALRPLFVTFGGRLAAFLQRESILRLRRRRRPGSPRAGAGRARCPACLHRAPTSARSPASFSFGAFCRLARSRRIAGEPELQRPGSCRPRRRHPHLAL